MRRGKRHPADDDEQDKTFVLQRDDPGYPLPTAPAEDPTRVHPVAAPPAAVQAAVEAPTEALRRRRTSQGPRESQRPTPRQRPATARRTPPALVVVLVLAGVLVLAIVIATSAGGGNGANTPATARTNANVRAKPTTTSQVTGSLTAGQRITIACAQTTATAGTWDRLAQPHAGRYVASWLVSPAGKVPAC